MEIVLAKEIDEILALDVLTLTDHTIASGDSFNAVEHLKALSDALEKSALFYVRRNDDLVAYCYLWQKSEGLWFIGGFTVRPQHRNSGVLIALFKQLSEYLTSTNATELQSNVYKTNHLSVAFHKKLGFSVTRENEKGFEFTAHIDVLKDKPWAARQSNP